MIVPSFMQAPQARFSTNNGNRGSDSGRFSYMAFSIAAATATMVAYKQSFAYADEAEQPKSEEP